MPVPQSIHAVHTPEKQTEQANAQAHVGKENMKEAKQLQPHCRSRKLSKERRSAVERWHVLL
jgi:hypothetical protein